MFQRKSAASPCGREMKGNSVLPDAMDVREQSEHIPFYGARIGELEFADRVVCRMRIKRLVIRIIGVFEICRIVAITMTTSKGKEGDN